MSDHSSVRRVRFSHDQGQPQLPPERQTTDPNSQFLASRSPEHSPFRRASDPDDATALNDTQRQRRSSVSVVSVDDLHLPNRNGPPSAYINPRSAEVQSNIYPAFRARDDIGLHRWAGKSRWVEDRSELAGEEGEQRRTSFNSDSTLYSPKSSYHEFSGGAHPTIMPPGPSLPPISAPYSPSQPRDAPEPTRTLRPALRRTHQSSDNAFGTAASHLARGQSARLEEGGIRANDGVLGNIFKLYSMARRASSTHGLSRSRVNSADGDPFISSRPLGRGREESCVSLGELDADDPKLTGVGPNQIDQEKHARDTVQTYANMNKRKKRRATISYHISSLLDRQTFMLKLAKALILFGSPSHRIEAQLNATARVLELDAQFVHLPSIVIASFGDQDTRTSQTHFIKVNGKLELGRIHTVHTIYRQVVHDEIGVQEATRMLDELSKANPIYGIFTRCVIAALCAGLICPLAFGGSFVDMLCAAGEGALLCYLQLGVASKNAMYSNVFEISVAILMSFIARALSSIPSQVFCYSAISSAGVVLVLPGYMILCSALELASKNIVSGSVKLTFAVVYSLFLGFGLTIGSDLYYLIDPRARKAVATATAEYDRKIIVHGSFMSDNITVASSNFAGSFSFTNSTLERDMTNWVDGCYRDPSWPWYLQPFPLWSLFILVPAFSLFSSSWNLQPFRSKQLAVMVGISCCSFAANKAANHYIFNRSDVVSAIGAFVVGILGNVYSRLTTNGTAFTSMVTGVLFLVPAGIAATGGLSMNYRGQDGDEYSNGLAIGLRMIQVAIGITVGLFGSGLVVYSFGRTKRSAMFAF